MALVTTSNTIADGSHGTVVIAHSTDPTIAIKKVIDPMAAVGDVIVLSMLDHPNIIKLIGVEIGHEARNPSILISMPKYKRDLYKLRLDTPNILNVAADIASGLAYLHSKNIGHGDLKTQNILVEHIGDKFRAVICDFGLAFIDTTPQVPRQPNVQSVWYRAPEVEINGALCKYGCEIDLWSLGCILVEVGSHCILAPCLRFTSSVDCICAMLGAPKSKTHNESLKLLLELDPEIMDAVVESRWESKRGPKVAPKYIDVCKKLLRIHPQDRMRAATAAEILCGLAGREYSRPDCEVVVELGDDTEVCFEDINEEIIRKCSPNARKLAGYLFARTHNKLGSVFAAGTICSESIEMSWDIEDLVAEKKSHIDDLIRDLLREWGEALHKSA